MAKDVDGVCGSGRFKLGGCQVIVTGSAATGCDGWSSNGWMSSSGSGSEKSSWITSTCMPSRSGSCITRISSVKQLADIWHNLESIKTITLFTFHYLPFYMFLVPGEPVCFVTKSATSEGRSLNK